MVVGRALVEARRALLSEIRYWSSAGAQTWRRQCPSTQTQVLGIVDRRPSEREYWLDGKAPTSVSKVTWPEKMRMELASSVVLELSEQSNQSGSSFSFSLDRESISSVMSAGKVSWMGVFSLQLAVAGAERGRGTGAGSTASRLTTPVPGDMGSGKLSCSPSSPKIKSGMRPRQSRVESASPKTDARATMSSSGRGLSSSRVWSRPGRELWEGRLDAAPLPSAGRCCWGGLEATSPLSVVAVMAAAAAAAAATAAAGVIEKGREPSRAWGEREKGSAWVSCLCRRRRRLRCCSVGLPPGEGGG
mmetsp:Transcript_4340/g.12934  ORF Transcript_4340/g.12934 Transcript_4340/m.12934 type:complete len:303 (+) Transcript_4340:338-1246(+)